MKIDVVLSRFKTELALRTPKKAMENRTRLEPNNAMSRVAVGLMRMEQQGIVALEKK